jgi:hypothetical protein
MIKRLLFSVLLSLSFLAAPSMELYAAALTPATVNQYSLGGARLLRVNFSTADDADTWASGINSVIDYWTVDRTNPATQASVGVAVTESSGTFTFYPAEDGTDFTLFVLALN